MTTLDVFLRAVAADPILVDDFVADPAAVLRRLDVPPDLWPILTSGDDVALLLELRRQQQRARE